ncbi:MAG: beta-lactamase family protein [Deltaproteobacteria bacterium]|nr:beta-lactamase family protein [Deltaproteobacteria bacterium]
MSIRSLAASAALSTLALAPALTPAAHATAWRITAGFAEPTKLANTLSQIDAADLAIKTWAVDPAGNWIIVDGADKVHHAAAFEPNLAFATKLNIALGNDVEAIACAGNNVCALVHENGIVTNGTLPSGLVARVDAWHDNGWAIRGMALTASGWILLGPGNVVAASGVGNDLPAAAFERTVTRRDVVDVAIGPNGRWLLYQGLNPMYQGLDATARYWVELGARNAMDWDKVLLGPGGGFALYRQADEDFVPDLADPSEAVEHALGDGDVTLWQRMADAGVPGLAIAIIEDGKVETTRGYGTRTAGLQRPVLAKTPFDLASLSKYVGAITTLAVLADLGGQVTLQTALTTLPNLQTMNGWIARGQAQNPAQGFANLLLLPTMPAITLEQLLSHTAGITTGGSTPVRASLADPSVSTLDWLSGWACSVGPCDWSAGQTVWFDPTLNQSGVTPTAPGNQLAYSSHGYLVVQAALEDLTGLPAATLVEDYVLEPMGLVDTTARFPFSASFEARVATQHGAGGPAELTYHPWLLAGGLVGSAKDYAELMLITLNDGVASNGAVILSQQDARNIRSARRFGTLRFSWGLGVDFDTTAGASIASGDAFHHSGMHPGLTDTYMCGRAADRSGIVILMNAELGDASGDLRDEILDAFIAAKGWTDEDCR